MGAPVGSPRGSVRARCVYFDLEYPPDDADGDAADSPEGLNGAPALTRLPLPAASAAAARCLGLVEERELLLSRYAAAARAGDGGARSAPNVTLLGHERCRARGGMDGDFHIVASPFDR